MSWIISMIPQVTTTTLPFKSWRKEDREILDEIARTLQEDSDRFLCEDRTWEECLDRTPIPVLRNCLEAVRRRCDYAPTDLFPFRAGQYTYDDKYLMVVSGQPENYGLTGIHIYDEDMLYTLKIRTRARPSRSIIGGIFDNIPHLCKLLDVSFNSNVHRGGILRAGHVFTFHLMDLFTLRMTIVINFKDRTMILLCAEAGPPVLLHDSIVIDRGDHYAAYRDKILDADYEDFEEIEIVTWEKEELLPLTVLGDYTKRA